ncbi:MAG: DNA polymerase III subunit alpha, partial [Planctomycetota bacterium]
MGRTKDDPSRLHYSPQLYLKSQQEMAELFADAPEALANTARIADRCHVELDASASHAPIVKIHKDTTAADIEAAPDGPPIGSTAWFQAYCAQYQLRPFDSVNDDTSPDELARQCDEALGNLCRAGLTWRYGADGVTEEIRQRLDRELKILADKRISAYFLIVWDFVNEARRRGIPAGARGSGVGTMVGYVLGLSNACPQRYGLLFERFTDPDRSEYPDIDIDMCQDGRGELIDYVRQKYGHVAQIITFGRLKARAAIKDVARVLGLTPGEGQRLSNFVPSELHITIDAALQKEPDFRAEYESNPTSRRVVDTARAIEGHARHAGVHAAGVVIATQPLEHIVPLYRAQGSDDLVTQWDGPTCERAGLLKMDFLGLRTLSTLELAKRLIRETLPESAVWKAVGREPGDGGPDPLDLDRLRYDDPRVFDLFRRGDTAGVFQFESPGMRRLLVDLKPDRIEDLIAANALFRPGPMDLIPEYTQRKHGRQPVPKIHEIVDRYTEETYGIMVYQEQVMQILHSLGDIPLRRAYTLIKAISKKKRAVIDSERSNFIEAAREKGLPGKKADDLYTLVLKFAGYGFNKCVVADTEVIDAHTGQRISVGDLFDQFQSGATQAVFVHALGDDGQLRPRRVTDVVWNGVCPVFELRTRTGRRIVATANHPFHTFDGWTDLAELHVGDRIAAPRRLEVQTDQSWPRHELIALAGLISEGNTCHPSCLYFYNNDQCLVEDFAQASHEFPESKSRIYQRSDKRLEVCVSIGRASRFVAGQQPWSASDRGGIAVAQPKAPSRSGMFRWAQSLGLLGCRASKKRLPAAVFQLQDADLELLLGRMWAGDGFICNKTQFTPFYATSSEQLAKDVQTLLLRLGIVSNIHRKMFRYRGGKRVGYTVHLLGDGSIDTFATRIGPHCLSREDSVQLLQRYASKVALSVGHTRSSRDTIPGNVRRWVDQERRAAGLTWRELERQSGVSMKEFPGSGSSRKRGFWRLTIAKLAKFFGSKRLEQLAHSDVYWDEVLSIEPIGTEDVYDLTVEEDHNFVADGLVVHNSHSTGYAIIAYETAYLKTYFPNHYMAAVLTYESAARKVDDWVPYLEDCKATVFPDHTDNRPHLGVEVKPPDVNLSEANFSVVFMADEVPDACRGHVRFGLDAIKGVSTSAINAIIDERRTHGPFTSIFDFCERVDLRSVNKATIEALVKSGAFDSMHSIEERSAAHAAVTDAISAGQAAADDRRSGQMNFFSTGESPVQAAVSRALPSVPPWERMKTLTFEKDTLGFFVSGHPLDVHET